MDCAQNPTMSGRGGILACATACWLIAVGALPLAMIGCQNRTPSAGAAATAESASPSDAPSLAATATELEATPAAPVAWADAEPMPTVPAWAADAVFYQIFPERFRNGDPAERPHARLAGVPRDGAGRLDNLALDRRLVRPQRLGAKARRRLFRKRRLQPPLRRRSAGVLEKLDYLAGPGRQHAVFQSRVLRPVAAQVRRRVDAPHRSLFRSRSRPATCGSSRRSRATPNHGIGRRRTSCFCKLVGELHRRDMRVIIDGVFNHTGRDFFAFADLREQARASRRTSIGTSCSTSTIRRRDGNEFRYKGWWGVETLPEFADADGGGDLHAGAEAVRDGHHAAVDGPRRRRRPARRHRRLAARRGQRSARSNSGAIGTRWCERSIPQAYTVAEIWDDAREFLTGGGFSATMNYHAFAFPGEGVSRGRPPQRPRLRPRARAAAQRVPAGDAVRAAEPSRLARHRSRRVDDRQPATATSRTCRPIGSTTTCRHACRRGTTRSTKCESPTTEERRIQRMVVLLQMTYVGAPMVYYGDEAGMWGGDDPCDRWPMLWDDLQYDAASQRPA